jgi:cell division septation protein DedD
MKVICPKCQFENQADSTRVVCARCATIIEVRVDQGSGFDSNGKRQTARLPFAANSSSGNSGNVSGGNSGGLGNPPQNRDVYATRIGDDFDDVLEIPRSAQNEFHNTAEATPVFEDVFSTNYDSASNYDFSSYEKKGTSQVGGFQTDLAGQRVTQDYTSPAEPEFMGWPVLPENNLDEEEAASGISSNRGGVLARVALIVLAFGVLSFLAYYFLWELLAKRKDQAANLNPDSPAMTQPAGSTAPAVVPSPVVNPTTDPNAPKTTVTPAIIQPKNPSAGNQGKEIVVPPITGRDGHSESPKPAPVNPPAPAPATPNRGNLTIQIGSFPDAGQANERASRLKAAQVDARVVRADIAGKGTWYRVQVGGFPSREEATSYGNQLRSKGLAQDFIVVTIGKP